MQMIIAIKLLSWRIRWTTVVHAAVLGCAIFASIGCTRPVPPEIVGLHGPERIGQDTAAVFTARINDEATEPVRMLWDFGNGYEDRGLRVSHVFTTEGSHTVRFRVENERGHDMRTWMLRVRSLSRAPQIATVQVQPNPVRVGERVQYETSVAGAAPARYRWTFGDGSHSEEAAPTHRYEAPGTYAVRVRVDHATGTDARTVQVEVEPDLPDFCTPPVAGNVVYFARNASMLSENTNATLRENGLLLQDCAPLLVHVEGHATADERNADALAADRAAAVVAAYRTMGIDAERIQVTHHVAPAHESKKTTKGSITEQQRVEATLQSRVSTE